MSLWDALSLFVVISFWLLSGLSVTLTICGLLYQYRNRRTAEGARLHSPPFVSVLVPAHNESAVVCRTAEALLGLDYPADRYEIIVINDNSTDDTAKVLRRVQARHPDRRMTVVSTDATVGGKGRSNALNIGLSVSRGTVLAVYSADSTPEPRALSALVRHLMADPKLGAVAGKIKIRNRNASLLAKFESIEVISNQCLNQAGCWQLLGLCALRGTNFAIRRRVVEQIGGWDLKSPSGDMEIGFQVARMGNRIKYVPHAVAWESAPERLGDRVSRRAGRMADDMGTLACGFKYVFDASAGRMRVDALYHILVYGLKLLALLCADVLILLSALGAITLSFGGLFALHCALTGGLFVVCLIAALAGEINEFTPQNVVLIALMPFTSLQLFIVAAIKAISSTLLRSIKKPGRKPRRAERSAD